MGARSSAKGLRLNSIGAMGEGLHLVRPFARVSPRVLDHQPPGSLSRSTGSCAPGDPRHFSSCRSLLQARILSSPSAVIQMPPALTRPAFSAAGQELPPIPMWIVHRFGAGVRGKTLAQAGSPTPPVVRTDERLWGNLRSSGEGCGFNEALPSVAVALGNVPASIKSFPRADAQCVKAELAVVGQFVVLRKGQRERIWKASDSQYDPGSAVSVYPVADHGRDMVIENQPRSSVVGDVVPLVATRAFQRGIPSPPFRRIMLSVTVTL